MGIRNKSGNGPLISEVWGQKITMGRTSRLGASVASKDGNRILD